MKRTEPVFCVFITDREPSHAKTVTHSDCSIRGHQLFYNLFRFNDIGYDSDIVRLRWRLKYEESYFYSHTGIEVVVDFLDKILSDT